MESGKDFPEPVLAAVGGAPRGRAGGGRSQRSLAPEFIYEQASSIPVAEYAFKHPLTQEVAYRSQLRERRSRPRRGGAGDRGAVPRQLDERAALLAHHWEASGEALRRRAGTTGRTWASFETPPRRTSIGGASVELAGGLPETPETIALMLHAAIAVLNSGIRLAMSLEQANSVLDEGQRLATAAGDVHAQSMLLSVYATYRGQWCGDVREYARLSVRALELAMEAGDDALYVGVGATGAYALIQAGDYRRARMVSDRVIELARGDLTMGAGLAVDCPVRVRTGDAGVDHGGDRRPGAGLHDPQ